MNNNIGFIRLHIYHDISHVRLRPRRFLGLMSFFSMNAKLIKCGSRLPSTCTVFKIVTSKSGAKRSRSSSSDEHLRYDGPDPLSGDVQLVVIQLGRSQQGHDLFVEVQERAEQIAFDGMQAR